MTNETRIDQVDLFATLTLHRTLLEALYESALATWPQAARNEFKDSILEHIRYKLRFPQDDGDMNIHVQTATIQGAEAFFAKVERNLDARA